MIDQPSRKTDHHLHLGFSILRVHAISEYNSLVTSTACLLGSVTIAVNLVSNKVSYQHHRY